MKIFINKRMACSFNYEYDLVYNYVKMYHEIVTSSSEADVILLLATCAWSFDQIVTTLLDIKNILSEKRDDAKVILSGCLTRKFKIDELQKQIDNFISRMPIDVVIPEKRIDLILNEIENTNKFNKIKVPCIKYINNSAYLHISHGCTNNCSFCKVCYQDIPLISVPIEDVYNEIHNLEEKFSKITLAGLNVSQYGLDLYKKYLLMDIVEYIEHINHIREIHFLGFAFKDAIKGHFDDTLKNSKKVNYIVGSLESGSDRLLQLMNKGFTIHEFVNFIDNINSEYKKDLFLTIIAGFPTETMNDVEETIRVVKEIKPKNITISHYRSPEIIPSGKLEQLSDEEIDEHAKVYRKNLKEFL